MICFVFSPQERMTGGHRTQAEASDDEDMEGVDQEVLISSALLPASSSPSIPPL